MKVRFIVAVVSVALSACGLEETLDAQIEAQDMEKCNKRGFANGTDAMATCMAGLANERQSEWARAEASARAEEAAREKKSNKKTSNSRAPASRNSEGTYRGQTGFDPATANMSMCSDGALREDCSNAPMGY